MNSRTSSTAPAAAHRRLCGLFDDKKRSIAMKTWFTTLHGAITLSALALLSFIGYAFIVARYFLEKWIPGDGAAMVETIVLLLIIGGWLRALFVAAGGRRGGLTALFAFSVLITLIALYDMQFVLYAHIYSLAGTSHGGRYAHRWGDCHRCDGSALEERQENCITDSAQLHQ